MLKFTGTVFRLNRWWTSGIGEWQELQWEGDGTATALDQAEKWEDLAARRQANLHLVYKFTSGLFTELLFWVMVVMVVASQE